MASTALDEELFQDQTSENASLAEISRMSTPTATSHSFDPVYGSSTMTASTTISAVHDQLMSPKLPGAERLLFGRRMSCSQLTLQNVGCDVLPAEGKSNKGPGHSSSSTSLVDAVQRRHFTPGQSRSKDKQRRRSTLSQIFLPKFLQPRRAKHVHKHVPRLTPFQGESLN